MPFQNQITVSFTAPSVQKNAPPLSGVYGLSNPREWIYVGQSENIRESLLQLLSEENTAVKERHPAGFTFELCPPERRIARQDALVRELEPVCNRGVPGWPDAGRRRPAARAAGPHSGV